MPQCQILTLQGVQCRRMAATGRTCCAQHMHITAEENERRRQIPQRREQHAQQWNAYAEMLRQPVAVRFPIRAPPPAEPAPQIVVPLADNIGLDLALARRLQEAEERAVRVLERMQRNNAERRENPVHTDPQNVHRADVLGGQLPILDALAKRFDRLPDINDTFALYSRSQPQPKKSFFQCMRDLLFRRMQSNNVPEEFKELVNATINLDRFGDFWRGARLKNQTTIIRIDALNLLSMSIQTILAAPLEHREPLRRRLLEEVREGRGYCLAGRYSRMLNAFAGFEEVVLGIKPVDPRSLAERLGDVFGALSQREDLDAAAKRTEGARILTENGVLEEAARAVWLEAL